MKQKKCQEISLRKHEEGRRQAGSRRQEAAGRKQQAGSSQLKQQAGYYLVRWGNRATLTARAIPSAARAGAGGSPVCSEQ